MQPRKNTQGSELLGRKKRELGLYLNSLFCLLALILLPGCSTPFSQWVDNGFKVGPNYCKPSARVESQWIDYQKDSRVTSDPIDPRRWWESFNDPQLDRLMECATKKNLTLRMAGERILQARAVRNIAAGDIFPQTQQVTADYYRTGQSQTVANPPTRKAHFDQWDAGFNLSWELDFWGRFRRGIEAADAALDASMDNYDSVNVILLGQVATSYINIRTYQERLRLARANVESTEKIQKIAQLKFDSKVISKLDLLQTKNNVSQAKALIDRLEIGLRQENNALCILLGIPPVDLTKDPAVGDGPLPTVSQQIDAGMPAQLLERRPDVRQAERLAAAQSARIGIAESDFYPHFAINGVFGWRSENLNQLFDPLSPEYLVGPSLTWNVLNYGRISNTVCLEEARFRELVFSYQNTVLTAAREVEDGIHGFIKSQDQAENLKEAVSSLEESLQLVTIQATEGGKDYNRIYVIQQQKTVQEDEWATARGNIILNLISVYQAMGGGW